MSRQSRRLTAEPLETRQLMAADAAVLDFVPIDTATSNTFVIADAVRVERLSNGGGGIFNDGGTLDVSRATDKEIIDALNNGTQITIAPINDLPTISAASAASADAVMARLQQIHSLISMTEGESCGI